MSYQNPLTTAQYQAVLASQSSPPILANCISGFLAKINATTLGVDVSFSVVSTVGISAVVLMRNFVNDIGTATVINTWSSPQEAGYVWSDTDSVLQSTGQAYYWLVLSPVGVSGTPLNVGPQTVVLNPDLTAPNVALGISASHAAASNGTVLVTINVSGGPVGGTIKIYASGYQGNASPVAVAQSTSSPIQFTLQDTGETVTFTAATVSSGGVETGGGPTTALTLNSTQTVPASPQGVTVAALTSGNQISWPSNADGATSYDIYRGARGGIFSGASFLVNVAATSSRTMQYLDTGTGDYGYFVVAKNGVGDSSPSAGTSSIQIPATDVSGLGDLAFINQANTINIVANAVNSSVVYQSTTITNVPTFTDVTLAQATITTNGGYVKVRCTMMIFVTTTGSTPPDPRVYLLKGSASGTQLAFYGNIFVPTTVLGCVCVTVEAVDASPATSQEYTVLIGNAASAMEVNPVTLVIENAKV